jgi:hypothetical protein
MASEALVVCFGRGFHGKRSDGNSVFDDDDATLVLTQVVPVKLDRQLFVVVVGDALSLQFDHCGAAVDLVQKSRTKREVDAMECFVQGIAEAGIEQIRGKRKWLPYKLWATLPQEVG